MSKFRTRGLTQKDMSLGYQSPGGWMGLIPNYLLESLTTKRNP